MTAYYNEIDPYAASWLENLIAAGHIAPGVVDRRDIRDVRPSDLFGFTQCHFFAGIGVWSLALRRGGWPDDRPIWTGSCPCQPFSSAGAGAGFDDERHLWPHFNQLIAICRPPVVAGEQVASKDADSWIDLVQADLEALDYAFGCIPFPAAGIGAPHIRDRNYWVADVPNERCDGRRPSEARDGRHPPRFESQRLRLACGLDHHHHPRSQGYSGDGYGSGGRASSIGSAPTTGISDGLPNSSGSRRGEECSDLIGVAGGDRAQGFGTGPGGGGNIRLANDDDDGFSAPPVSGLPNAQYHAQSCGRSVRIERPGPTNGLWGDADWLLCRDGRWRPVEPGTFPLAYGATSRVGRLRAYGNAIVAQAAETFIRCYLEHEADQELAASSRLKFAELIG